MPCLVRDLQDQPVPTRRLPEAAIAALEARQAPVDSLCIVLVDDHRIRDLNARFRGLDQPTDVLSFEVEPAPDQDPAACAGEIVIAIPTARRQADAAGIPLEHELAWLTAHGALHIAGMDDETQEDLDRMCAIQQQVLTGMGWPAHP